MNNFKNRVEELVHELRHQEGCAVVVWQPKEMRDGVKRLALEDIMTQAGADYIDQFPDRY